MVLTGTYIPYSTPTYHIGHILDPRYHDMAPQMPQSPWARAAAPLDLPPGSRGGRPPSRRCSCPRGSRGRSTTPPAPARAAAPYEPPPRSRGGRPPSPSPPPPRREEQPPSQEPSAGPPPAPGLGPLGPLLLHCAHLLRDARLPRPRSSSPSSYPPFVVKIHAKLIWHFPRGLRRNQIISKETPGNSCMGS